MKNVFKNYAKLQKEDRDMEREEIEIAGLIEYKVVQTQRKLELRCLRELLECLPENVKKKRLQV